MPSIKLTVKRLYALKMQRMAPTSATAKIYLNEELFVTEVVNGMTESPVVKFFPHNHEPGKALRVEWQTDGIAEMAVEEIAIYQICND